MSIHCLCSLANMLIRDLLQNFYESDMQAIRQDSIQGIASTVLLCLALGQIFTLGKTQAMTFLCTKYSCDQMCICAWKCEQSQALALKLHTLQLSLYVYQPLWACLAVGTQSRDFPCPFPHAVASPCWVLKCHQSNQMSHQTSNLNFSWDITV